jgi:hypothetical protein
VHFTLSFKIMYLIPEDGLYDQNMWHVLMGLIKFVVVDSNVCVSFSMLYHNGMNFTKIVTALSEIKI